MTRKFENTHGTYSISDLPGNSEVGVSHDVEIFPEFRNLGNGQIQHQERLTQLTLMNYVAVVATVRGDNKKEQHILIKNGWHRAWTFLNKEGDPVQLWVRSLLPS